MADSDREPPHAVAGAEPADPARHRSAFEAALAEAPWRFGLFNALRRLEAEHAGRPRLGESVRAVDDPVRLSQEPSLAFAPATLASFKPGKIEGRPQLAVFFTGLFGPNGPLPHHLTEFARDRERNLGDATFRRFADIFHHRILSLFYRAWANAQPVVEYDRPDRDRFSGYVGSLFGMLGEETLGDPVAVRSRLHYSGLLGSGTRHADGLSRILESYLRVPCRIEEFIGQWVPLETSNVWELGSRNGALGSSTMLGTRVWVTNQKIRIMLGPMPFKDYQRLLPGGRSVERLRSLVHSYIGYEFDWDVRLILRKEEVPSLMLGSFGRIGWTTWMGGGPRDEDAGDLVFDPQAPVPDDVRSTAGATSSGA